MAIRSQVKNIGRVLFSSVLVFFLYVSVANAAPSAPTLSDSEWLTGEILIHYDDVIPGAMITVYIKRWDEPDYTAHDVFIAPSSSGTHLTKYFENGQSIWFYITQSVIEGGVTVQSGESNHYKLTPPITAYIVNWPENFGDLGGQLADLAESFDESITGLADSIGNSITGLNDNLTDYFDNVFTPSGNAMDDLNDSINDLKDAVGIGHAEQIGDDLITGFNGMKLGLLPPIIQDDGINTYSGGLGGFNLPGINQTDGMGLTSPDLDSGTDTELTMRIPLTVNFAGDLIYMKLFTKEQMDKFPWIDLLRTLAIAAMWIIFSIWIVTRFTPQFKT